MGNRVNLSLQQSALVRDLPPITAHHLFTTKASLQPFIQSLLSGEVPIAWKAATVCPLFKGDQADPNCYRPISILCCLSEVLEKLVNHQLTDFLDVCGLLWAASCCPLRL